MELARDPRHGEAARADSDRRRRRDRRRLVSGATHTPDAAAVEDHRHGRRPATVADGHDSAGEHDEEVEGRPAASRPDQADRSVRRRRRDTRAAGVRGEPRRRQRRSSGAVGRSGRRRSRRVPLDRDATVVTNTTCNGAGSRTTCGSTRTRPRAWSTNRSRMAARSSCRRCTCCPTTWRWRTSPTPAAPSCNGTSTTTSASPPILFAPQVEDQTGPDGTCRPPLVKLQEWAMIHVWIVPHECGPFAALEGIAAGSILKGEERWCDHTHGS